MAPKVCEFPCGKCKKKCLSNTIFCEQCKSWYHGRCQKISNDLITQMSQNSSGYVCQSCRCTDNNFDFAQALNRLTRAAANTGDGDLRSAAEMEQIYLRLIKLSPPLTNIDHGSLHVDRISSKILEKCGVTNRMQSGVPVISTPDGNCYYNSLSISLYGDESKSTELRVRVCMEMVLNHSKYNTPDLLTAGPDYEQSCRDAATNGGYSSAYTMAASANVVNRHIYSVYPTLNGLFDRSTRLLNRTFVTGSLKANDIRIMWTHTSNDQTPWTPNHFVPLITNATSINLDWYSRKGTKRKLDLLGLDERNVKRVVTFISPDARNDDIETDSSLPSALASPLSPPPPPPLANSGNQTHHPVVPSPTPHVPLSCAKKMNP